MQLDLSKAGIAVAVVSLLSMGVTVVGKWFSLANAVQAHAETMAEMKDAYQLHDKELDENRQRTSTILIELEHLHRDVYALRKELRMSDRGLALPPLGKEDEE